MNKKQKEKIDNLIEKSREVFRDCLLPNGCLVAAPTQMPYYPSNAKSYLYCWPGRDLGFNVTAGLHIGIDVFEDILSWIWERAEDYQTAIAKWKEGLLFRSYHPNGRIRENSFQPDQTGTLLWVIYEYSRKNKLSPLAKKIVKKSAKGLVTVWTDNQFKIPTEDPWEERIAHPRFKNNLIYSLASCAAGLKKSDRIISNYAARKAAEQMVSLIGKEAYDKKAGYFLRRFGGTVAGDKNIDASLLALVWPFEIIKAEDPRMIEDDGGDVHSIAPMERAQVYSSPAGANAPAVRGRPYIELELTSAPSRMKPGDAASFTVVWELARIKSDSTDALAGQVLRVAEQMTHQTSPEQPAPEK